MSKLLNKMKKASVIEQAAVMSESEFFNGEYGIHLPIPIMNLAFSGSIKGKVTPGMNLIAGPSKHFKSNLCLVPLKAFLDQHPNGVVIFYDSEFGTLPSYFESAGIDTSRVLHVPVKHLEEYKFDLIKKLEEIEEGDEVFIYTDSLGNLASKKEVDDAKDEKSVADMTRAKVGKSIARMITPYLKTKKIFYFAIQHVYDTMEMYSKKVLSGGTGWILSADNIFIMGKRQVKEGTELTGFEFVLNTDKSRCIKEKSSLPITVTFSGGISKYSGLLDIAVAVGHVVRPNNRSYVRPFVLDDRGLPETRLWKRTELDSDEFWEPILNNPDFDREVSKLYSIYNPSTFTIEQEDAKPEELGFDPETGEIEDYIQE